MRDLTGLDGAHAVLGGGVLACGGGGWLHHGELMAQIATSVGTPVLAGVDDVHPDTWVATVTAIGAPAAATWEIQPRDYVRALERLMATAEEQGRPIGAVMTAQNGFSTSVNGWIQSAMLRIPVLDAAGDVRAHPTGKLGALGLTDREGYASLQVVCGGNRALHGYFESTVEGSATTCDDVLRDISVRTGGFIASARNPVEIGWVKETAAIGAISLALGLGTAMAAAARRGGPAVIEAVCDHLRGTVVARGPLRFAEPLRTVGGWDHGTFRVGAATVPYLNEYMAVDLDGERWSTYPDTITLLSSTTGLPLAVKDAVEGLDVSVVVVPSAHLPLSASAVDPVGLAEVEQIMGISLLEHRPLVRA